MSTVHIHAPRATAKQVFAKTCPDCGKRTRMLAFFTPWYGSCRWRARITWDLKMETGIPIDIGQLVRVVSVHHPVFNAEVGSLHSVASINGATAWVRPHALYSRKTRTGVVCQRATWESLYGLDQLEPAPWVPEERKH